MSQSTIVSARSDINVIKNLLGKPNPASTYNSFVAVPFVRIITQHIVDASNFVPLQCNNMNAQLTEIIFLIINLIRAGIMSEVDLLNWLCRVKTGRLDLQIPAPHSAHADSQIFQSAWAEDFLGEQPGRIRWQGRTCCRMGDSGKRCSKNQSPHRPSL